MRWSPNRDTAGAVLLSDFEQLPLLTWLQVDGAGNRLVEVIEQPHYPSLTGADGSPNIVAAWGGAAWDPVAQRLLITGGGHGDAHPCDTGVYALAAGRLQFTRVVDRQPLSVYQTYADGRFIDTLPYGYAWYSVPMKNGVPSSWHTYDGLVWVPPGVAGAGAVNGGLVIMGAARAVVNLDSGAYSTAHWYSQSNLWDWTYQMAMLDGTVVFGPRSSFQHYRFDLAQTEATAWSPSSQGRMLASATSTKELTYNHKAFCWMRERRQYVSFAGNQAAVRVRYGQAIDAGASNWTGYHDSIALTSSDGSHLDFSAANLRDTGTNLLCSAGADYDAVGACIWVQANLAGSALYQISGLDGSTWTTRRVNGPLALTIAAQGTFGRFRIASMGSARVALRVTSTTTPIEVLRLA